MFKSYKYRIYPTEAQKVLIEKHIGACRFVYNLALETKNMVYSGNKMVLSEYDLQKQLTGLKTDLIWLKEVNSQSLSLEITHLKQAFDLYFNNRKSFPKFKKKKFDGRFSARQHVKIIADKLFIPKFNRGIRIRVSQEIVGNIKKCTISKTPTGKYFASLSVETGIDLPNKPTIDVNAALGVDLGLKSFLVTSSGEAIESPQFLRRSLSALKYVSRKYSKHKGKRTRKKLAQIHEKVANQRKDFLHKTSTMLIRDNQTICVEDLTVSNMVKNHSLALSITDSGWYEFRRQLEYKADWYGKNVVKIGGFEPSSKTCSACGAINHDLTLKDREWSCCCGAVHDRDLNAAINIKNFALKNLSVGRRLKSHGKLPALAGALTHEAHCG